MCKYLYINILLDIFVYILIMGFEIKARRKNDRGRKDKGGGSQVCEASFD